MNNLHDLRIPLYRTRRIFLIVIGSLYLYWLLAPSLWPFQGKDIILVDEVMGLMSPIYFLIFLADVSVNGKYLFLDHISERRISSLITLSVEILFLLGTAVYTAFLVYFIVVFAPPDRVAPQAVVESSISGQGIWEATLNARDLDNNTSTIEAYYDAVLGITWLKDANYAKTSGDYGDGRMNWSEANDWATNLDINGVTGWRLPKLSPINGIAFDVVHSNDATTDNGHALTTTDGTDGGWRDSAGNLTSEMGHMYYVTLGNISRCSPGYNDRCVEQLGSVLFNTGTFPPFNAGAFSNVQRSSYWTTPETEFNPNIVTAFTFNNGEHGFYNDIDGVAFTWAVHDGDVGTPISK